MGVRAVQRKDKPGWWVLIHHKGQRKKKYFGSNKSLALEFAKKLDARLKLGEVGISVKTGLTLEEYSRTWLEHIRYTRKASTHEDYTNRMKHDITPVLGSFDLHDITRERVKLLAIGCLSKGQAPKTVQNIVRCLSSLLSHAVEDQLIVVNPALRPGKFLPKISKRRKVNPLSREEVSILLATAKAKLPRYFPLFLCAVRTGMRMGELLALQWSDIDWQGRFIEVQRNYTHWKLTTPKNGESRRVDMSRELGHTLEDWKTEQQINAAANGSEVPHWVFPNETGGLLHPNNLRDRVFYGLLTKAKLRKVRFHDLRHTFASLLLQNGESPVYVKDQMGHSSIQVTVDLYGHLIPGGNKQAVDRLDSALENASPVMGNAPQAHPAPLGETQEGTEASDSVGSHHKWHWKQVQEGRFSCFLAINSHISWHKPAKFSQFVALP